MLGVGRAAAIAAPQDFVAIQQRVSDEYGGALEDILLRLKLTDNGEVFCNCVGKNAGQIQRRWHSPLVVQRV